MPDMHLPASQKLPARPEQEHAEDALGLDEFLALQDPVDVVAAQWLAQQEEGLDTAQAAAFSAWIAQSPHHQQAYDSLMVLMGKVAEMPALAMSATQQRVAAYEWKAPATTLSSRWAKWRLRRSMPFVLTLLVVCVVGWHAFQDEEVFADTYTTARNEHRHIALPDDSQLTLDTKTTVAVSFTEKKRVVTLPEGQAFFQVAARDNMPFEVLAGQARITVVGTRFSVRYTKDGIHPDTTQLAVEEGHVRIVKNSWWPWQKRMDLYAGDTVIMTRDGQLGNIIHTDYASPALLWRTGRIDFSNVPLSQAISEFERYGDTHVVIHDPAVAQLRVQGSFDLQRVDAFMRAIPQALPVYPVRRGQLTELLGAPEVAIK